MKEVSLAVDVLLEILINPTSTTFDELLDQVKNGAFCPTISDIALYSAFKSIRPSDQLFLDRFAGLIRISRMDASPWIRFSDRISWEPKETEIRRWRDLASD